MRAVGSIGREPRPGDLPDADRRKLIRKALEFCGEPVTEEAVERQFRYETKGGNPHEGRHKSRK